MRAHAQQVVPLRQAVVQLLLLQLGMQLGMQMLLQLLREGLLGGLLLLLLLLLRRRLLLPRGPLLGLALQQRLALRQRLLGGDRGAQDIAFPGSALPHEARYCCRQQSMSLRYGKLGGLQAACSPGRANRTPTGAMTQQRHATGMKLSMQVATEGPHLLGRSCVAQRAAPWRTCWACCAARRPSMWEGSSAALGRSHP